jgi:hypothetical protein
METKTRPPARQAEAAPRKYVEVAAISPARPLRALLLHLDQSEPSEYGRQRIAEHAQTSMRIIQLGLGAIGHLLAQSAVQVEDRTIPAECMENLGTLMAELSDFSSVCFELSQGFGGSRAREAGLQEQAP